jgi:hypothetical protein
MLTIELTHRYLEKTSSMKVVTDLQMYPLTPA